MSAPSKAFIRKCEREVIEVLRRHSRGFGAAQASYYNSTLGHLGALPVPLMREISKRGYSFSKGSERELAPIWSALLQQTRCFEVASQALLYAEQLARPLTKEHWLLLREWAYFMDNWAHADGLCQMYSYLYESYPVLLTPTLREWNAHKNPWLRRISIVSLIHYARIRHVRAPTFATVLSYLKPLLLDEHFYVQRGVGWTTRELFQLYPGPTLSFIEKHAHVFSSSAWSAATEKLTAAQKAKVTRLRKEKFLR